MLEQSDFSPLIFSGCLSISYTKQNQDCVVGVERLGSCAGLSRRRCQTVWLQLFFVFFLIFFGGFWLRLHRYSFFWGTRWPQSFVFSYNSFSLSLSLSLSSFLSFSFFKMTFLHFVSRSGQPESERSNSRWRSLGKPLRGSPLTRPAGFPSTLVRWKTCAPVASQIRLSTKTDTRNGTETVGVLHRRWLLSRLGGCCLFFSLRCWRCCCFVCANKVMDDLTVGRWIIISFGLQTQAPMEK